MNAPAVQTQGWTLAQWRQAYREGAAPETLLAAFAAGDGGDNAWIARLDADGLAAQLAALAERLRAASGDMRRLPFYGVPFAVKDNIDARGWPTTAACPPFAYRP